MIDVKNLSKSFGDHLVLDDLSEHIYPGEKVVVIGPSGSGKSTFLRCLNLLETPTAGTITFNGVEVTNTKTNIDQIRQQMGMVFQHFNLFPNMTPRISGIMHLENGTYNYAMSILKSNNGNPDACNRYTFAYENPVAGEGHFIHTYMHDGNPLPSFEGEPKLISVPNRIEEFTDLLWNSLNEENKVSLFVRYIDIATGDIETKIVNKNQ